MTEAAEPLGVAPDRKIALLIDADNVSHNKIGAMLAELSKYGTANIRRAYGNWASDGLKGWKDKLHDFAIRPIQQFNYSTGKNATDIALVIDAMELLYTQKLDAFCLASSDADFTPLVMQLRANGHEVYGFGERKTPSPFVNACTAFLYLDSLEGEGAPASNATRIGPSRRHRVRPFYSRGGKSRQLASLRPILAVQRSNSQPEKPPKVYLHRLYRMNGCSLGLSHPSRARRRATSVFGGSRRSGQSQISIA